MSKQIYFVIGVDLETKEVFIDDETFTARFDKSEQVWNSDTDEWEEYDEDGTLYAEALEILNTKHPRAD